MRRNTFFVRPCLTQTLVPIAVMQRSLRQAFVSELEVTVVFVTVTVGGNSRDCA